MLEYYTYILIDPRTSQPFYVGKGKGRRLYDHWKHRHAKCVKNWKLKQRLCELDSLGMRPIYNKVLEHVSSDAAFTKEVELILQYGRLDKNTGYLCNLTDGGENGATSWSLETRQAKSKVELSKNKGRPVTQYSLDGDIIATFPSAKRAAEAVTTANRSYITQCCKGKRKSSGGFLWTYEGAPTPVFSKEYYRAVDRYTKDRTYIDTFRSMTDAAQSVNVSVHTISSACRSSNPNATAGGFLWKYHTTH